MEAFFTYDPLLNGVKGLVFVGDKLLVYRRDAKPKLFPLFLDLPGGGAENGETPFETFQREVKEEFGLDIQKSDIVYARQYSSVHFAGTHVYFPVARLPKESEKLIHFGNEGLEYLLMGVDEFLAASDVWPVLQEKTITYLKTVK